MGDGSSVDVWNSSWIPRASSQRPLGRRPEAPASMLKVSDLLTDDGLGWNDQKLRQFMYEFDVEDIKKIPVGGPGGRGLCCLELDEEMKNGQFLVRSAYHLKMQQKDIHSGGRGCSNSVEAHKGWLALWGANVPGKVKVHVWRLLKNGLVLGAELQRRKIKLGIVCIACGREETALHRCWHCPHAQQFWMHVNDSADCCTPLPPANVHDQRDIMHWMLDWFTGAKETDIEITMMSLYHCWLARNDAESVGVNLVV